MDFQNNQQIVTTQQVEGVIQQYATPTPGVINNGMQSQPNVATNVQTQPVQSGAGTFTQEQLNAIVGQRVNEVTAKFNGQIAQYSTLQESLATTQAELTKYKNTEVLRNSGVNPAFNDFITFNASQQAVNGKTFEQAVGEFLQANPQYAPQQQVNLNNQVLQSNTQVLPQSQQLPVVQPAEVQTQQTNVNTISGVGGINPSMVNTVTAQTTSQQVVSDALSKRGYKIK